MIFNILNSLTDPDNIPSAYSGMDIRPILTLIITIIAVAITLIAACIIYYLIKNYDNETIKNKTWIKPTIILTAVGVIILIVVLGYFACAAN